MEYGVSARPLPGETESGDLHLIQPFEDGMLIAVVDGVGHGSPAAAAARAAVSTLQTHAGEHVAALMRRCHERLKSTRGAVMSLASFNGIENTMTWAGVGNIEGWMLRSPCSQNPQREILLKRCGVAGYRLPPLQADSIPVRPGDLLILATDGIRLDFAGDFDPGGSPESIADSICSRHSKGTDDGLVLVARYLGWSV